jgi:valyl-tRNA synthetase
MRVRYEHWVQNLSWDWCISRQRYYGVPFPAWHCRSCGATVLAAGEQLPVDPLSDPAPRSCACGSNDLAPDEDVMDTWATSSLSPQIVAKLFEEPELHARLFPMQLRPQAHDIIRTWSFYTIVKAHFHFGTIPWEALMISGHALDPSGRKIGKSKGNSAVTPSGLIERHSADAVRYWACSAGLGGDQPLSEERMKQGRRLGTKLWNAARFASPHLGEASPTAMPSHPTDRWLLSALQGLIDQATARWLAYDYAGALELTERFFWGTLCDQYLELAKGRLYDGAGAARDSARHALAIAFEVILKLLAPIMPHITEELFGRLFPGRGSIHVAAWPEPRAELRDAAAEAAGAALLALAGAVRRHKSARGLSLGAPLTALRLACADAALREQIAAAEHDLRSISRAGRLSWAAESGEGFSEAAPGLWIAIEE